MAPGNDAPRFVHGNTFFEFERFVGCDKFAPANAGTPVFSRAPIGVPALAIARLSHPTKRSRETKIHNVGCDKFARANAGTPVFALIIACSATEGQADGHAAMFYVRRTSVCLHSLSLVCHTLRYSPHSGSSQPGTGSMPPQSRSYSPSPTKR